MTMSLIDVKNKNKSNTIYWILCVAFCGLYFLRDVLGVGISYYFIQFFAAFIVLTLPKQTVIAFIISISLFMGAGYDSLFAIMLLLCVALRFLSHLKTVKLYSLLLIVMCVLEGIHFFSTDNLHVSSIIPYIAIVLVLFIIQQYPYEKTNSKLIVNSFIVFSLFFVLVVVIRMWQTYGSLEKLIEIGFRSNAYDEMQEASGLTANQNYITSLCSLNLGLCTLMISKKASKHLYLVAIILFAIVGLMTVSKMFIAVIVAYALYVIFVAIKKNFFMGFAISLLFIIAGLLILNLFGDTLIKSVIGRFQEGDLTTGRTSIIGDMFVYMNAHPLTYFCGMGILQTHYYLGQGVHSSLFELIGGWGILGTTIAIVYIITLIRNSRDAALKRNFRPNGFNYLPILMFLGYSLIGMLFSSSYDLVKLMVAIYAIQLGENSTS